MHTQTHTSYHTHTSWCLARGRNRTQWSAFSSVSVRERDQTLIRTESRTECISGHVVEDIFCSSFSLLKKGCMCGWVEMKRAGVKKLQRRTVRSLSMLLSQVSSCSKLWISSKRAARTCSSLSVLHVGEKLTKPAYSLSKIYRCFRL